VVSLRTDPAIACDGTVKKHAPVTGHEVALHTNHPSAAQFRRTVAQKANRNDTFRDLCLNTLWATSAPGQPPINAKTWSVFSGVRHVPRRAADLSIPYAMPAATLAVR